MSTKPTPGPWGFTTSIFNEVYVFGATGNDICTMGGNNNDGANARLICAAPDMLAALIAMEAEKSNYMVRNKLGNPAGETTNQMARAAIAKATVGTA